MTVGELEQRMSRQEFFDWQDFYSLEPFLSERVDLAGALVASTIANVKRAPNSRRYEVRDFMIIARGLEAQESKVASDDKEDMHLMRTIAELGGTIH